MYSVGEIFKRIASNYDLMNDLMSFGTHRFWKDCLVGLLEPKLASHWQSVQKFLTKNDRIRNLSGYRNRRLRGRAPGLRILDLAGGTGDVAFRINELSNHLAFKEPGGFILHCEDKQRYHPRVAVIDPCEEMLRQGILRQESQQERLGSIEWIPGSAEDIPQEDSSADIITISFGARNFEDLHRGLIECKRVLKPNGRLYILEFSACKAPVLSTLYSLYSHLVIPKIGKVVADNESAYQYLVDSIDAFPNQIEFSKIISDCGFRQVSYLDLSGGIAAIHQAAK